MTHAEAGTIKDAAHVWWQQPFEMFQTNLRETDVGLDVEAALDRIIEFGANTWLLNTGGILASYPSRLPFQTINPHLASRPGGDLIADAVSAAHRRGVRLLARMDFSKVALPIAEAHSDWCFVDADGNWQIQHGLVSVSPSGEYFQQHMFEIVDEVMSRYEIDGFYFNWFGFSEVDYTGVYRGVSQDTASRDSFAEFSGGQELPIDRDSATYDLWRRWSRGVIHDLSDRMHDFVKSRRPDVALILRDGADIFIHEANNAIGRELWPFSTSEAVSAIRTVYPDAAAVVNSVTFFDMPYRMAAEQPERFVQYLAQAIARGANPSTYIMGIPGDIPYGLLRSASAVTTFRSQHHQIYAQLRPAAEVVLIRPDPVQYDARRGAEALDEFRGIYSALQEDHLPFDVLPAEDIWRVGVDRLRDYDLVVVPDLGELDQQTLDILDSYAAGGGRLLLTGSSATARDGAAQLAASPVTRITHIELDPQALKGSYITAGELSGADQPDLAPVYGVHYQVQARDDAEPRLRHVAAAPYGPPEKAYGNDFDGQPGYLLSGSGRVAAVPWTIGRAYRDIGLRSIKDLLLHSVRALMPAGLVVSTTLPEAAELTVQRGSGRLVFHILNLSGAGRRNFGSVLPISGAQLSVRAPGTIRALIADCEPGSVVRDGTTVIDLPTIADFEVIVIEDPSL